MLPHTRSRRRFPYGPLTCAIVAVVLILLSVGGILHTQLSFFNSSPQHNYSHSSNPLVDDLDSDPIYAGKSDDDRIDVLDESLLDSNNSNSEEIVAEEEDEDTGNTPAAGSSNFYYDHIAGVIKRFLDKRSIDDWEDYVPFQEKLAADLGLGKDYSKIVIDTDDLPVDLEIRELLSRVKTMEDVLMLKGSVLREGWGDWYEKKGDYLRKDPMFKSIIDSLNPLNDPHLQDPVTPGVTQLTKGDKLMQKMILDEFERTPFLADKKPLSVDDSKSGKNSVEKGGIDEKEGQGLQKKTFNTSFIGEVRSNGGSEKPYYADGNRWGYYLGLDGRLSFGNFMDAFFRRGRCTMRFFMVWNSPPWMFGVRQQRGLESLLHHHRDACVVVFSETIELNFFNGFVKDGYKVAVVMPNLDELLKDTPTHVFASVWLKWRKTKYYPTHYSELIRLASLYKYGGIYLDSDIIVLKPLSNLNNTVGCEDELPRKLLNGAVMAFKKHSPYIWECLEEFHASYDHEQLQSNGADLLTRVAEKFLSNNSNAELLLQPSSAFFPIGQNSISRYFTTPATEIDKLEQDILFNTIMAHSLTVHFWNSLTSALIPESDSLVLRLLNQYCIRCYDAL